MKELRSLWHLAAMQDCHCWDHSSGAEMPDPNLAPLNLRVDLTLQDLLGQVTVRVTLRCLCASHVGEMSSLWLCTDPMIGDLSVELVMAGAP